MYALRRTGARVSLWAASGTEGREVAMEVKLIGVRIRQLDLLAELDAEDDGLDFLDFCADVLAPEVK